MENYKCPRCGGKVGGFNLRKVFYIDGFIKYEITFKEYECMSCKMIFYLCNEGRKI